MREYPYMYSAIGFTNLKSVDSPDLLEDLLMVLAAT